MFLVHLEGGLFPPPSAHPVPGTLSRNESTLLKNGPGEWGGSSRSNQCVFPFFPSPWKNKAQKKTPGTESFHRNEPSEALKVRRFAGLLCQGSWPWHQLLDGTYADRILSDSLRVIQKSSARGDIHVVDTEYITTQEDMAVLSCISLRIHIDQPGFLAMYHGFCCQCSWRFFEWVIPDSSKGWSIVAKRLGWVKAELIFSKERPRVRREQYWWWKKSCTTWDLWNHVNNWISHLSTGAGFQPSTVCCFQSYLIPWRWIPKLLGDDPGHDFGFRRSQFIGCELTRRAKILCKNLR